jgi:glucokinase
MQDAGVPAEQITAVGVGSPGPVDAAEGLVVAPPNLPGWDRVPLRQTIEDALGIPTYLENDANAAALGENVFGAGRGTKEMIYMTVSTGVGGGFIFGGKLYGGASGAAAEVGHMTILPRGPHCGCGNRGCLEAVASGTAIAREGRELLLRDVPTLIAELAGGDPDLVSAKVVAQAAQQGDAEAEEIIYEAMSYLGVGVANLVNLLNPELIVIGGGLTNMGDALFGAVRRAVDRRTFPIAAQRVRIVPAELGDRVGVLGAAAVAMQRARVA